MPNWCDIPGFPGYQVSELGEVRDKWGKIKRQHTAAKGAGLYVRLGKSSRLVHKLVLMAFVGPRKGRITHRNGNRRDNRLLNLSYGERSQVAVSLRCSKGHPLVDDNVVVWGNNNRICVACRDGRPARRELPEYI